ncbi:unnamed protein product [Cylicocyclus nassatus]|uniref:Uncharacterized protein n=1 Tax=Cylicocyclus nassatus TaxID=53992 RepID=A0AA36M9K3_CYLNA|nr:unnamed protein product [Cylicocyclus nassatus]
MVYIDSSGNVRETNGSIISYILSFFSFFILFFKSLFGVQMVEVEEDGLAVAGREDLQETVDFDATSAACHEVVECHALQWQVVDEAAKCLGSAQTVAWLILAC